jgi:hypothetical protein
MWEERWRKWCISAKARKRWITIVVPGTREHNYRSGFSSKPSYSPARWRDEGFFFRNSVTTPVVVLE